MKLQEERADRQIVLRFITLLELSVQCVGSSNIISILNNWKIMNKTLEFAVVCPNHTKHTSFPFSCMKGL